MNRARDDLLQRWPSSQQSESLAPTFPRFWAPTSNSNDFHSPGPWAAPSSFLHGYLSLMDPFAIPVQPSTEGSLPHQGRLGVSQRSHDPPSHRGTGTPEVIGTSTAASGRSRSQSDREGTRLERKNTKRRKTGPDRFENYLHGETSLPPYTTTMDVFTKYPNHITDEDNEECWRLGLSARQISDLMPDDTHFNSDGVLVQQHHSLIQKKFKTFKERYEMRQQIMKDPAAHREGQGLIRPSNGQQTLAQGGQYIDSGASQNAVQSTTGMVADLPDLKFRYYPFDPTNDKAFEARMSIEIAEVEPMAGHIAHEDHEIRILDLLLRREFQRHADLLKHLFFQEQTLEYEQASLYNETSRALLRQWHIHGIAIPTTYAASEALRLLQHIIDQIYLHHPGSAAPSAKRPIFNIEHRDLRMWKVFARTLYYLIFITRRLEAGPNVEAAGSATASSGNGQRAFAPFADARARLGSQKRSASDGESRRVDRLLPVRCLPSTASSRGSVTVGNPQSPYAALGQATSSTRINSPQAQKYFASSSSPTIYRMSSTTPGVRVSHEGAGDPTAQSALPLNQSPQTSGPPADSLQPGLPMTSFNHLSEADNYIAFPSKSY
jgi:hypothetical protein